MSNPIKKLQSKIRGDIKLSKMQINYVHGALVKREQLMTQLQEIDSQMNVYFTAIVDDKGKEGKEYDYQVDKGCLVARDKKVIPMVEPELKSVED
jgi:hypothetical protein